MTWLAGVVLAFGIFACGNSDGANAPPPGGGGVSTGDGDGDGGTGRRDGGGYVIPPAHDDEDGGAEGDAGFADNCEDFEPAPPGSVEPPPGEYYNTVSTPADWLITRAAVGWEASCVQPTIHVELSDGSCDDGDGHELRFLIPADGIENSTVVLGQNAITPEPASASVRVRYSRPGDLDPAGVWGTCEGSSGTINFVDQLETEKNSLLEATFQLSLTRCDTGTPSVQMVNGSFSVKLEDGLDDVCP